MRRPSARRRSYNHMSEAEVDALRGESARKPRIPRRSDGPTATKDQAEWLHALSLALHFVLDGRSKANFLRGATSERADADVARSRTKAELEVWE